MLWTCLLYQLPSHSAVPCFITFVLWEIGAMSTVHLIYPLYTKCRLLRAQCSLVGIHWWMPSSWTLSRDQGPQSSHHSSHLFLNPLLFFCVLSRSYMRLSEFGGGVWRRGCLLVVLKTVVKLT